MKDLKYKNFYETNEKARSLETVVENDSFRGELTDWIEDYNLKGKKFLEIGSGNGKYQDVVSNYTGIDVAESLRNFYHKPYYVIKVREPYPFPREYFDAIFTRATFEHIPNISQALKEMLRVLSPGGMILFHMAWWVRPWASRGIAVRPLSDLSWQEKLIKLSIPIRELTLFRFCTIFPKRVFRTLYFLVDKQSFREKLRYRRLEPNYDVKWGADSDACNSIDPHSAILYFKANNCEVKGYNSLMTSLFVRYETLIVKKNEKS